AAWALARIGDLDVVPELTTALLDNDPGVVETARLGLQLLSRKLEGLGPPPDATPEQRQEAARRWRDWYEHTRPLALDGLEADEKKRGNGERGAGGGSPTRKDGLR